LPKIGTISYFIIFWLLMRYVEITNPEPHIVVVTVHKPEPTPEEFQDYLARMLKVYKKHENIVVIYDTSKSKFLKAEFRIQLGLWLKKHRDLINHAVYGVAYVFNTPMTMMMMKGVFLVQQPIWRNQVFSKKRKALDWAHQLIQENQ